MWTSAASGWKVFTNNPPDCQGPWAPGDCHLDDFSAADQAGIIKVAG
jgi:hypothetical protein